MLTEVKDHLRATVRERIFDAEATIKDLEAKTAPIAPDVAIGRLSRMDAIQEKEVNSAILAEKRNERAALAETLQRIDLPGYGHCAKCGDLISPARLEAIPETTHCIKCA